MATAIKKIIVGAQAVGEHHCRLTGSLGGELAQLYARPCAKIAGQRQFRQNTGVHVWTLTICQCRRKVSPAAYWAETVGHATR